MKLLRFAAFLFLPTLMPAQSPATLLRDVRPGGSSSGIMGFTEMMGRLFFSGQTAVNYDLHATDGTPAGTAAFNLPPGCIVQNGVPVGSGPQAFFVGRTTAHGRELWASDGTTANTRRVTDLNPGPTDAYIDLLTPWRGYCFFSAVAPLGPNYGLWRSDGTAAGTVQVGLWTAALRRIVVAGDKLFFVVVDPPIGDELWVLDDPMGTPHLVRDIRPGPSGSNITELVDWRGQVWFNAEDGTHGIELWTSDGTAAGTTMVVDVNPGSGHSRPSSFTPTRDWLFFIPAEIGLGGQILITNGTANGTTGVPHSVTLYAPPGPTGITAVGNVVYARGFVSGSAAVDLWRMDGSMNGTWRVRGADPNRPLSPQQLRGVGSRYVYFQGDDGVTGLELWRSDGTTTGTTLVADVIAGAGGSAPYLLRPIGGSLVFVANTAATGVEPFAVPLDASAHPIGAGCGAGARVTTMAATDPVLGQVSTLSGVEAFAGSVGLVFLGFPAAAPLPIPLPSFSGPCRLLLAPASIVTLGLAVTANGEWSLPWAVPNGPGLQNLLLRAQGAFTPTDAPAGIDVTNAVNLKLGL